MVDNQVHFSDNDNSHVHVLMIASHFLKRAILLLFINIHPTLVLLALTA